MKKVDQKLASALFDKDSDGVQKALSQHANPNIRMGPLTPLLIAVMFGLTECIEPLIRAGARVNAHDSQSGRTSLHYASMGLVSPATIEALIKAGANVNAVSDSGWTPLDLAACCGNEEIIRALIAAGGHCHDTNRRNWIERAKASKPRPPNVRE